jgi:hypothetical protein
MTTGFESIKITGDMPEPSDISEFFITDEYDGYSTVATVTEYGWFLPGYESEFSWEEIRDMYIGWSIQSLADHDARIRADALNELKPKGGEWFPNEGAVIVHGKIYFESDYVLTRNDIRQIRTEALELSDKEHDIATQAIMDALRSSDRNDYGIASESAFKAVVDHRKEQ